MKKSLLTVITSCACLLLLDGCKKDSGTVWDDSTTIGSYKRAKDRVLWGSEESSSTLADATTTAFENDFVPLQDEDLKQQFADTVFMQPTTCPGEVDSPLPGIDGFEKPMGSLASVFKTIHFGTDDYSLKDTDTLATLNKISTYLKEHAGTYLFVAGHCDQRAPEAYNLSLGSKRANAVRNQLIQLGVNPEQIHTISYGKERLANPKNTQEAWAENRRAEFKIYTKH